MIYTAPLLLHWKQKLRLLLFFCIFGWTLPLRMCTESSMFNVTYRSSLTVLTGRPLQTPHSLTCAAEQLRIPEETDGRTSEDTTLSATRTHCQQTGYCTSRMMKNSSPGSPWTTIFWPSSNCTGSRASATVRRSHLSRDSAVSRNTQHTGTTQTQTLSLSMYIYHL